MQEEQNSIFESTAQYYSKYRIPYPVPMINALLAELHLTGNEKLLDIGCGTGLVIEAIGDKFAGITAIDPDPAMIKEAKIRIKKLGLRNVDFYTMSSEEIHALSGSYDVVTFGSSFHWTNRQQTAQQVLNLLNKGGYIVLSGSDSIWNVKEEWQGIAVGVIKKWLGEARRAGKTLFKESSSWHEDVLRECGFTDVKAVDYQYAYLWTIDFFIGHLYSTSFASKALLGKKSRLFEHDMREALLHYNPKGVYPEKIHFYYIHGKKPTSG